MEIKMLFRYDRYLMKIKRLVHKMLRKEKVHMLVTCAGVVSVTYVMYLYIHLTASSKYFTNTFRMVNVVHQNQLTTESDIYKERARVASDACFKQDLGGQAVRVYMDKMDKMAFCVVPKVGCTFWINIFRFLNNETNDQVYDSPFDIPRIITHYSQFTWNVSVYLDEPGPAELSNRLRFMFVRDPYSRLWSAWIDKFLLPDFWMTEAVDVARFLNVSETVQECPKDISFEQFLAYITSDGFMEKSYLLNEHWAPYRYVCDPCLFRPHIIGKIETFSSDTQNILERTNLTWVLRSATKKESSSTTKQHNSQMDRSLQEMYMLTYYNMEVVDIMRSQVNDTQLGCFNEIDIYKRLWTAFQYNGHLPHNVAFYNKQWTDNSLTTEIFLKLCAEVYIRDKLDKQHVSNHVTTHDFKRHMMVEAYNKVSDDVMKKVQKLYSLDFEMFGYSMEPEDLFRHR